MSMTPKLIDSHSHLNFNAYKDDGPQIIRRALDNNIWLVNVGSQYTTSKRAVNIASQYEKGVYAAIGLHPIHLFKIEVDEEEDKFTSQTEKFKPGKYQELINPKVVAVGEIGLDYFHLPENKTLGEIKIVQEQALVEQIKFAQKNNLPLILHCRGSKKNPLDAYYDLINILTANHQSPAVGYSGVIHCFGGNLEIARQFIKQDFFIGFTGIITFKKNAELIKETVKQIPLEKILVETDCPYLAPEPHRGERNEPSYVKFVAQKIADLKKIGFDEIAEATTQNAKNLFRI